MSEFHFLRPWWLLALLPWLLLLWQLWRQRSAGGDWARICDAQLLPSLVAPASGGVSPWPGRLLGLGGLLAILALAGPTWQRIPTPVYQTESALVVVFDLSRSMESTDLAPDRLTRSRYKLADLLRERRDGLTGLVVFAHDAYLAAPLSDDSATILHMLEGLDSRLMPNQGSRLKPALALANELLLGAGISQGSLLLISDGDGLESDAEALLSAMPHRLLVLGVGTAQGAPIPYGDGFLKDADGNIIVPRLDERRLRALAEAGDGAYVRIRADAEDVKALLAASQRLAPEGHQVDTLEAEYWRELGPWLLLPLVPLAALGFRRGYLVLLLGLLLPLPRAEAWEWNDLWRNADQRAYQQLQQGEYDSAAATFSDPRWRATALYRQGRWAEAEELLADYDGADDWYNRGNALAAEQQFEAAMAAYRTALQREPDHADANHNLERLQALQEQQQNPDEQNQGSGEQAEHDEQREAQTEQDPQAQQGPNDDQGEPQEAESGDAEEQDQRQSGEQSQPGEADEQASEQSAQHSGDGESGAADARRGGQREADEQWLRRIREDPAELLRRKFMYLSRQRDAQQDEERPW